MRFARSCGIAMCGPVCGSLLIAGNFGGYFVEKEKERELGACRSKVSECCMCVERSPCAASQWSAAGAMPDAMTR